MKKSALFFILFLLVNFIFGQTKYHRAKIYYNSAKDLFLLANQGVVIDHGKHKKGVFIESDFSENELNIAKTLGLKYEVLINDVSSYYKQQSNTKTQNKNASCTANSQNYTTPTNYNSGSMGGFLTYSQMLQELDDMANLYPNLITIKQPISNFSTVEGRPIFWVKISDNPSIDETEPEILYTAVHHAREPGSLQQTIFYMWYLLENYNSSDEVQALINNTEMYFVPCVNPDGYIYNETTDPSGGGMWRKNRRDNLDGNFGVDLNRNYGYQWGGAGTSTNTSSDVYLGTSAFSEVETQAMKWFCEQHNFKMALNSHTYSNLLLYPFGYALNQFTPDNATFVAISGAMVQQNGYINQISSALYAAAGDSDDWMYGETSTHSKILAMTPEVGSSFWPAPNSITSMCKEMVYHNLMAANIITNFAQTKDKEDLSLTNLSGYLKYEIQRLGLDGNGDFTVSIQPISSNIASIGNSNIHNGMTLLQTDLDSISYTLNNSISQGDIIIYEIVTNNGLYNRRDTITKTYGNFSPIFTDNGNAITNWQTNSWGVSSAYAYSPSTSITDSPNGNYANNATTIIQWKNNISLANAISANVSFYARWNIEDNYDYVQLLISTDGGNTWEPQCGNYTNAGTTDQIEGEPLYDGVQNAWIKEEINLSNYIGQNIDIRFQLVSDQGVTEDGFYFDDFSVNIIESNNIKEQENVIFGQNIPNPTNDLTSVFYKINNNKNAKLEVFNQVGKSVMQIPITNNKGNIVIDTKTLASGIYFYSINNNGVATGVKKMIVIK